MFFQYVCILCDFVNLILCSYVLVKHVPAWFPGAGFKRFAQECRVLIRRLITEAFDEAVEKIVSNYVECSLARLPFNW